MNKSHKTTTIGVDVSEKIWPLGLNSENYNHSDALFKKKRQQPLYLVPPISFPIWERVTMSLIGGTIHKSFIYIYNASKL
jgi:hypothetical protein